MPLLMPNQKWLWAQEFPLKGNQHLGFLREELALGAQWRFQAAESPPPDSSARCTGHKASLVRSSVCLQSPKAEGTSFFMEIDAKNMCTYYFCKSRLGRCCHTGHVVGAFLRTSDSGLSVSSVSSSCGKSTFNCRQQMIEKWLWIQLWIQQSKFHFAAWISPSVPFSVACFSFQQNGARGAHEKTKNTGATIISSIPPCICFGFLLAPGRTIFSSQWKKN